MDKIGVQCDAFGATKWCLTLDDDNMALLSTELFHCIVDTHGMYVPLTALIHASITKTAMGMDKSVM